MTALRSAVQRRPMGCIDQPTGVRRAFDTWAAVQRHCPLKMHSADRLCMFQLEGLGNISGGCSRWRCWIRWSVAVSLPQWPLCAHAAAGATSAQRTQPPTRHGQHWSDHDDPDGCPAATQSNVGAGPSADSVAAQRAHNHGAAFSQPNILAPLR